jgi:hypothetical protein
MPASRTLLLLGALAVLPTGCASDDSDDDDDVPRQDAALIDAGPGDGGPGDGGPGDGASPDANDDLDAAVDAGPDATPDAPPMVGCSATPPMPSPETVDGVDNDCDGLVDEITVCAGQAFTTIGAAITAAPDGGTVFVCAGTYAERLTISGKRLFLIGTDGDTTTIIDGGAAGTAITVENAPEVVIDGFTIRNGSAATGGGIRCATSKLRLHLSTVTGNAATAAGGGIHATGCELDLDTSLITQNAGGELGGGALIEGSSGTIHGNNFVDNDAVDGGGLAISEGTVVVADNLFRSNTAALHGGALHHSSDAMVANNSFVDNSSGWTGGGIYVFQHAATFSDNTVQGNHSENDGGGIYVHQGSATFRANHIIGNSTADDGGGLRLFENRSLVIGNIIEQNTAGDAGGGIRVSHVPATFMDNTVRDNTATGTGGGMDMDNDASTVIGGTIAGNRASSGGGVFHWLGPWNGAVFTNVRFTENHAWRGGALYLDDNFKPVTMRGLIFERNEANRGGAIHVRATNYTITGALFTDNEADYGGAIWNGANTAWSGGPCTSAMPCPPIAPAGRIEFSVFHGNTSDTGAAIWIDAPNLTVRNSIIADNIGPSAVTVMQPEPMDYGDGLGPQPRPFPTIAWTYNDTTPATFIGITDPTGTGGNLSGPPLFMDTLGGDYHLGAGSMCIDAGAPEMSDMDGTRADMGRFGGPQ